MKMNFKYKKVDGYSDPNAFLNIAYAVCTPLFDLNKMSEDNKVEIINYSLFLKRGAPIYCIGKDVYNKVINTKISDDISYKDLKFPLKSCTFMLPDEKIITYSVVQGMEDLFNGSKMQYNAGNKNPDDDKWFFCGTRSSKFTDATLLSSYLMNNKIGIKDGSPSLDNSENETILFSRIFCIKMIMLLQERTDLTTNEIVLRKGKNGNKGKTELRSMRTIGSIVYDKKEHLGGWNASPMVHIRKGHFRKQPVGPRDGNDFKIIWIEPMMINAGLESV